jgi:aminopeptidase YwaD
MNAPSLREASISRFLQTLAVDIGARPTGSTANQRAEAAIAEALAAAGLDVERQPFDCRDWSLESVTLSVGGVAVPVSANPFCPATDVDEHVVFASTLGELAETRFDGAIVALTGSLTAEPLFPRNFPFVTVEEHQSTLDLLDAGNPAAVICVSPMTTNPAPVIEDGDFCLPSVTVPGPAETLLRRAGQAHLRVRSAVRPSTGANVIARRRGTDPRPVVICAHFDTKPGTPGALDNAAGVAALLAAAWAAREANPALTLEFIAFNGEDYYASSGQVAYLERSGVSMGDIRLVINLDGVGLRGSANTVALFGAEALEPAIRLAMDNTGLVETEPWPQGDHMLFAMRGVPCIALTSDGIFDLLDSVIHTPHDTMDGVDTTSIGHVASFIETLWRRLAAQ